MTLYEHCVHWCIFNTLRLYDVIHTLHLPPPLLLPLYLQDLGIESVFMNHRQHHPSGNEEMAYQMSLFYNYIIVCWFCLFSFNLELEVCYSLSLSLIHSVVHYTDFSCV